MNADENTVRQYIELLHGTVRSVGDVVLAPEQASQLVHNSLLPAAITAYVSTQFGVALEYAPAEKTIIRTVCGSARVEDLVFSGPRALRKLDPMLLVKGNNSSLGGGGTFSAAFPFRLAAVNCDFTVDNFNFEVVALGWKRHVHFLEVYGDRSTERWSAASAKARAKDEVLAAVYIARQASQRGETLSDYVNRFRKRSVLVLGAYNADGQVRLAAITAELKTLNYEPVLVADIPDFEHYDLSQKVVAIGAVCRFIVIDDSAPSGHLNEVEVCKMNRWVTVLLRAQGVAASSMTLGASISSNVIHELSYDPIEPARSIAAATEWAEQRLTELEKQLQAIYPFRATSRPTG